MPGTIIVEKQTDPDGASDSFTFTGDAAGTISDDQQIIVSGLSPGTYTSQETVPSGWGLTSIVCDDSNSSGDVNTQTATFQLEAGETVICIFTNAEVPPSKPSSFYGVVDITDYTETATTDAVVYRDDDNDGVIDGGEPEVARTTIWYDGDTSQWVYIIDVPSDNCNEGNDLIFEISKDPVANGDTATVDEDSTNNVINVLANDTDGVGIVDTAQTWNEGTYVQNNLSTVTLHGLTISSVGATSNGGTATTDGSTITYTPAGDYCGSESFTYEVTDNNSDTDTATVDVTVTCINDPPDAVDDSATVNEGGTVTVLDSTETSVLANDTDAENDTLTVNTTPVSGPTYGSLTLNADGTFSYTHDDSENHSDSFTYQVCDNGSPSECDTATVNITVRSRHSITLQPGWNLVSFNLQPVSTVITDVLSSIDGDYDLVYAWDASVGSDNWKLYDDTSGQPNPTLSTLDEKRGFWIHITAASAVTLDVDGTAPSTTQIHLDTESGGWNLVGYPAAATGALAGILDTHGVTDFSLLYAYHANDTDDPWKLYDTSVPPWANDLNGLDRGWGYWIKVGTTDNQEWTVAY